MLENTSPVCYATCEVFIMPRIARQKSSTGIYHVIIRGINRQSIFIDDEDDEKFMETLVLCKNISGFKIFGYCLMGNHLHLLIKEEKENIEQIFRRIGARYVYWYNWKYKRSGHLFQDRFKSEAVEDDKYFITVLRYIHQNPKKAGLCKRLEDYQWSSYKDYLGRHGITDTGFSLDLIGEDRFAKYMNESNNDQVMEMEDEKKRLTDQELSERIFNEFSIKAVMIQSEPKDRMFGLLEKILEFEGVSARQVSRVTGISANIIWKLASK